MKKTGAAFLSFFLIFQTAFVWAADPSCEVIEVHGKAYLNNKNIWHHPLRKGDVLKTGDSVEMKDNAQVRLAFDPEWNKVATLEKNSFVEIRSLSPGHLFIKEGAVLAKLAKLPKGKSFQLSTPVNVAAVQGSAYEAVYRGGIADVYNLSASPVQVFGFDEKGKQRPTPLVLKEFQKTRIPSGGATTLVAEKMQAKEKTRGQRRIRAVEGKIKRRHAGQAKAQVSPAPKAKTKTVEKKPAAKPKPSQAMKKKTPAKKSMAKKPPAKKSVVKKTQSPSQKAKTVSKKPAAKKAKLLPAPKPKSTKKPAPKTGG